MAYFDGLIETILAVGLVKPKQGMCKHLHSALILNVLSEQCLQVVFFFPGILQPHIHYLLVLATSVDVVILGLSFPKSQAGESFLQLCHSDSAFELFPVASDYVHVWWPKMSYHSIFIIITINVKS